MQTQKHMQTIVDKYLPVHDHHLARLLAAFLLLLLLFFLFHELLSFVSYVSSHALVERKHVPVEDFLQFEKLKGRRATQRHSRYHRCL